MHTYVREIHLSSECDSAYFLRVDWEGRSLSSGFQLLLTDGQEAWRGEVGKAVVSAEAEELEMQRDQYVQDLQRLLTGAEDSASYSFTLDPHPAQTGRTVTLTYEKMQKDISFRLGSAMLEAVAEPTEAVRNLLVHSLQRGNHLQQKNQKLEEQNQQLIREQQRITSEMKRYAGGKEVLEAELFSRFVLVLNEKKAKIRSLQETIMKLQDARTSDGQKSRKCGTWSEAGGQGGGAEDDEYSGSTDEDAEDVPSSASSILPSADSSAPSLLDDSLRDITDVAPCRKRRLRHVAVPDVAGPNPETSQRKRSDSNPGSSKKPTPQSPAVEDLFEDF